MDSSKEVLFLTVKVTTVILNIYISSESICWLMDSKPHIRVSEHWGSYLNFGINWKMDKISFDETASFSLISFILQYTVELSRQMTETFYIYIYLYQDRSTNSKIGTKQHWEDCWWFLIEQRVMSKVQWIRNIV